MCLHKGGASRIWEPSTVTTTGPGGVKTREVVRKYGWRCDLSVGGDSKLKQADISTFLASAKKTAGGTVAGSSQPPFSDVSVGQMSDDERAVTPTHVSQERFGD